MAISRLKSKFVLFEELHYVERQEKLRIIEKVKIIPQAAKVDFSVFSEDEIVLPVDDGEPRDRFHLLEEVYDIALPRLLALQAKYPPGSLRSASRQFLSCETSIIISRKNFTVEISFSPN